MNLSPEFEELVRTKVETGRYKTANEVVQEALWLLDERDRLGSAQLQRLQDRIDEGLASLDRGQGIEGKPFMTELLDGIGDEEIKPKPK